VNLALKGILGIRAMAEISRIHGDDAVSDAYLVRHRCFSVSVGVQIIKPSISSQMQTL
jgi:hypothetical protein